MFLFASFHFIKEWELVYSNSAIQVFICGYSWTVICRHSTFPHTQTQTLTPYQIFGEYIWEKVVLDPSSGFIYLQSQDIAVLCDDTHTRSHRPLESVSKGWGQGLSTALGWSVHPFQRCALLCTSSTTVTCCGSGQLSLCPHTAKSHFTFPALMTEMEYAWIVSSSERARKERNAALGCHSCACSCPLKNVAELSAQLQFYRISVPRQLSNEWHVLHPPKFVHFHQPKIAHKASIFL